MDYSEHYYLRLMTKEDTDDIIRWRNSEGVKKHFIYQQPFTKKGHEIWIQNMINTGKAVQMIICERSSGKSVGSVYIRDIDRDHHKGEYGIFIGEESARGCGIGTIAAKQMISYCREELKLHKLYLRVYAENERAIRSYEKAGFEKEAYLKEDVFINGEYRDMILMGIIL